MAGQRGNVRVTIVGDASGLDKATRQAEGSLGKLKKGMAVAAVGVAGGVAAMVNSAADFEQQMSTLGSVTDANARQMKAFRQQALDAGAATKFSASEAAAAQIELAKGGLSIANIAGGGLRSALALAAAGNLELADAAAYTANAMNLFGLEGSRSMKVADAFATAANATTADVSDFGMALTQGGGAAKSAGLSFGQTMVALEALAQSGIKGSDAGTSLKAAMVQLANPTDKQAEAAKDLGLQFFNAEGRMRPLVEVSGILRERLGAMGDQQRLATLATLAGTDGFRTLLSLYDQGPAKVERLTTGIQKQGTAAKVAARQQDNLKGRLEALGGSIETISILAGSVLIPPLTEAASVTADFVGGLASGQGAGGQFASTMRTVAGDVAGVAGEVGDVALTIGQVGANVARAFVPVATASATAGASIAQAFTPVVVTVGRAAATVATFSYGLMQTRPGLVALTALVGALTGRMVALGVAWGVSRIMGFVSAIRTVISTMGVLRAVYVAQTGITNASTAAILRHAVASRVAAGASRGLAAAMASTGFGALLVVVGSVAGALMGMKSNTDRAKVSAQQLNEALRNQADALRAVRDIDIDVAQRKANVRSASIGVAQAQARVNRLAADGQKGTLEYKAALADLAQAKVQQRRATRDLGDAEEDSKRKRQDAAKSSQDAADRAKARIKSLRDEAAALEKAAANAKRLAAEDRAIVAGTTGGKVTTGSPKVQDEAAAASDRLKRKQIELANTQKKVADETAKTRRQQLDQARASGASRDRIAALKDELGRLRDRSDKAGDRVRRLRREIGDLRGTKVSVDVSMNLLMPGVGASFPGDGRGDGWGLAKAVRKGVQAKADANPGAFLAAMPGGGLGNGPVGAVDQFTPAASRFGLSVSSGFRPGSITSSGNVSLHALNRARDYAGSAASMLAFARFMAGSVGGRLKELIHSPLGFAIKNGQRVPPYAVADHYDHVHVGLRRGGLVPAMLSPGEVGVTPGGGVFEVPGRPVAADTVPMRLQPGTAILTGDGQRRMLQGASLSEAVRQQAPHFREGGILHAKRHTFNLRELVRLNLTAGMGRGDAGVGAAVAMGESSGRPWLINTAGNSPAGSADKGLYQINDYWNRDDLPADWSDPFENTKAANKIQSERSWNDWVVFKRGIYKRWHGAAAAIAKTAKPYRGGESAARSFTRLTAPKITHPLLGDMLDPLVDDALMGGVEAGMAGTGRRPLLRQVLEGIVPESDDRATREKVTVRGGAGKSIARMIARGNAISAKKLPYQYGGYGNPSYDCSGFNSAILNAGGLLRGRLDTVAFKSWGKPGRGSNVTLGIKGGSGKSGHMMMQVGRSFYEANPSGGVGRRSGWTSNFTTWRRPAWRRGGLVGPNGRRMLPPSPEGAAHLKNTGGVLRFGGGGNVPDEAYGSIVGTEVIRGPRGQRITLAQLIRMLGGSPGTQKADRLTRKLAGEVRGESMGELLARQRQARRQVRSMAQDGFTGPERIQARRLRGAISLIQDEMGQPIGRSLGRADRAQERIGRAQSRADDLMVMDDIDPESMEGNLVKRRAATTQLRTLGRRRRDLLKALKRARRTRNRAVIARVQGELNEVDDQMLGLRAGRKGLQKQAVEMQPTARDFAQADLAQAELTAGKGDDIAALNRLQSIAQRQYDVAVRSGDPREIAEAAGELKSATEALKAATPTDQDFADMDLALAELTAGSQDDLDALARLRDIAAAQLAAALASGDPKEISDAARALKQSADALRAATPQPEDYADRDIATAKLTETLVDDIAATEASQRLAQQAYDAALLTDDPRDDIEAVNKLIALNDSLRSLKEEMSRSNELAQQKLDYDKQRLELDRKMVHLSETQGPTILASLIDLMNDGVGGQAKRMGRTPGVPGVAAAYS